MLTFTDAPVSILNPDKAADTAFDELCRTGGTLLDCARVVKQSHQAIRVRPSPEQDEGGPVRYQVRATGGRGFTVLDAVTAGAIVAVCERINDANKAKLLALPLVKAVAIVWKCVK